MEFFKNKNVIKILGTNDLADEIHSIPFLEEGEKSFLKNLNWGLWVTKLIKVIQGQLDAFKGILSLEGKPLPKQGLKGVYYCLGPTGDNISVSGSRYFGEEDWAARAEYYPDYEDDNFFLLNDIKCEIDSEYSYPNENVDNLALILVAFSIIKAMKTKKPIKEIGNASIAMGYSDGEELMIGSFKKQKFAKEIKVISEY